MEFSDSFIKGNNFHYLLFAYPDNKAFPKRNLLLTLVHSEKPKLYGVLAVLTAIRLKGKIAPIIRRKTELKRQLLSMKMPLVKIGVKPQWRTTHLKQVF